MTMTDFMKTRDSVTVVLDDHMGDEEKIVRAAQVSTKGQEVQLKRVKDPARFVRWLMEEKHGSPLEHVVFSFYLEVPIFVSRQIVKYRLSSINEESGRYHEFDPVGYIPKPERPLKQVGKTGEYKFEKLEEGNYQKGVDKVLGLYDHSKSVYGDLLDLGWAKEMARIVLPTGVYSSMFVTMNLRNWLHFLSQRAFEAPSHGQWEIALVAEQVAFEIEARVPNVYNKFIEMGYPKV